MVKMLEERLKAGILVRNTRSLRDYLPSKSIAREIKDYINKYSLDIFLGPEFIFSLENRLYNKQEKNSLLKELAGLTKNKGTLIMPGSIMWEDEDYFYNTAPLIFNGRAREYHKHRKDDYSIGFAKAKNCKTKQYYSGKSGAVYPWRGYTIGIEICVDKLYRRLDKFLIKKDMPLLDLYFLVSCGVKISHADQIPIKNLGYGLCSDGEKPTSEVLQRNDRKGSKNFSEIGSLKIEPVRREGFLDIYEVIMKHAKKKD